MVLRRVGLLMIVACCSAGAARGDEEGAAILWRAHQKWVFHHHLGYTGSVRVTTTQMLAADGEQPPKPRTSDFRVSFQVLVASPAEIAGRAFCVTAAGGYGSDESYHSGDIISVRNNTMVHYAASAGVALVREARRMPYDPLLAMAPLDLVYCPDRFDTRLVRRAMVGDHDVYVVECRPKSEDDRYSRRELYLDTETLAIVRHDVYTKRGGGSQENEEYMSASEVWYGHDDFGVLKAGLPYRREITRYAYLDGKPTEIWRTVSVLSGVGIYMSTPDPSKAGKRLRVAGQGPEEQPSMDVRLPGDTLITFDEPAFWRAVREAGPQ